MNQSHAAVRNLVTAAMLSAVGIAIPMFFPKIILGPASFTLASHVPVFLAMFISPMTAVGVALLTTLGFFLGGFPLVIVARAATHLLFATVGATVLARRPDILDSAPKAMALGLPLSLLHAAAEVIVVMPFYYAGSLSSASYSSGFMVTVVLLVGVGGVVHSMVDYTLSLWVWKAISPLRQRMIVSRA